MERFNLNALAIATGIVWGGLMAFAAITATFGYAATWVTLWANIYPGYGPGALGALLGFIWGVLDAAVAVLLVGWVYRGVVRVFAQRTHGQARTGQPRI